MGEFWLLELEGKAVATFMLLCTFKVWGQFRRAEGQTDDNLKVIMKYDRMFVYWPF